MSADPIPAGVREFLVAYIDSIAQLEALLLLRDNAGSDWIAHDVAKRLYITEQQTTDILARLAEVGLAELKDKAVGRVAYRPRSATLAEAVDRVAEVYRRHLVAVTNLVHAKRPSRVQQFADAFKLRKEE